MSLRTSNEIQADLVAARAARLKALTAQQYNINTGQTSHGVMRPYLNLINETIHDLESELDEALARERGDTGVIHLQLRRGG
ncbi:MAG TPA: hypothetical protein VFH17_08410 [Coriobacteriia bacterium]|nr:hypothetical protein [Coriobacteriia bacterium]